jgi:hypothetical protein
MKVINYRIEASLFYKKIAHKFQLIFIIVFIISIYDSAAINLSRLDENEPDFVEVKSYYKNLINHKQKTSFSILADKFSDEDLKQRGAEYSYNFKGIENFLNDKPLSFIYPELSGSRKEEKSIASNDIIIYPNPTSHSINLRNENNTIIRVELINSIGQTIQTFYNIQKQNSYDVSKFPQGLYYLKIIEEDEIFYKSFNISR